MGEASSQTIYRRSKKGRAYRIYELQKRNAKKRGHTLPLYSSKDLLDWLLSQPLYHHIHHLWAVSGYDSMLTPSVDRINSKESYTFSNIQLMTWGENNEKGKTEKSSGRRVFKPILVYTKEGEFVAEFANIDIASIYIGKSISHIDNVCRGYKNTAGGYICKFKVEV